MYGLELIIIIFATLAQALTSSSEAISIVGVIIFWRVLMGVGIGGGAYSSCTRVDRTSTMLTGRQTIP